MAQPDNNNTLSSAFKTFFEREKLTGDNFNDWYRSLRIVLRVAGTYDYLFKPCPEEPPEDAAENVKAAWKAEYKIHSDVACLMLGRMSPALQRQFELYFPQAMLDELRRMFEKPKAVEIYDLVDTLQLHNKPKGNFRKSLNKDFGDFVDIQYGIESWKTGKSKGKADKNKQVVAYQPKPKQNPPQKKENPKKDQACHYCNVVGHWKRNCPLYLEELRTNKNKKVEHGAATSVFTFIICCGIRVDGKLSMESNTACGGVVSFSRLLDLGFVHTVTSNGISVSSNGIFYFSAISVNGVFEIDMNDNVSKTCPYWQTSHAKASREGSLEIELQLGKKIKALQSDRGGEYLSQEFKEYLGKNGIVHLLTSPYTPQQNGVSERRNCTLLNMVRSMFNLTTLPLSFWDYALESAVWGCEAYMKRDSADKLQQRSVKCIFVGYPKETNGYYLYFPHEKKRSERIHVHPTVLCLNMEVEMCSRGIMEKPALLESAMLDPDRNTRDMFLVYGRKPEAEQMVTGFCDASWQCDKHDTKSQTGYVFVVNGGAVDWKSKKQTTIAMSAAQAEYMAASEAAMEAVWIRKFVGDLG
ncbi:retrotransposon protein, putative, ty1-copia subclass [Tanacetum coccineum]